MNTVKANCNCTTTKNTEENENEQKSEQHGFHTYSYQVFQRGLWVVAVLLSWRVVRGCGWFNAVLGGQQPANAEEEEEEGKLDDEGHFLYW